jgi:hypothetical protein
LQTHLATGKYRGSLQLLILGTRGFFGHYRLSTFLLESPIDIVLFIIIIFFPPKKKKKKLRRDTYNEPNALDL